MILYTPLAAADIFPQMEDTQAARQDISYGGKMVYTEQKNDGSYEVLKLLSTDPNDFLDQNFAPGSMLHSPQR